MSRVDIRRISCLLAILLSAGVFIFPAASQAAPGQLLYTLGYDFAGPKKIGFDAAGRIYVPTQAGPFLPTQGVIRVYEPQGRPVRSFGESDLVSPLAVVISGDRSYVADGGPGGIAMFDSSGSFLRKVYGYQFEDVTALPDGRVIGVDGMNNRLVVFDANLNQVDAWGATGSGPGQFLYPRGADVDSQGNVHVADSMNQRVQVLSPAGGYLRQWPANAPVDVACGPPGNVYVLSQVMPGYAAEVLVFSGTGDFISSFTIPVPVPDQAASSPIGLTVDAGGNILVSDPGLNRITKFSPSGEVLRTLQGVNDYSMNTAIDGNGDVCVGNLLGESVSIFSGDGDFLRTWKPVLPPEYPPSFKLNVFMIGAYGGQVLVPGTYAVWEFDKLGNFLGGIPADFPPQPGGEPSLFGVASDQYGYLAATSGPDTTSTGDQVYAGNISAYGGLDLLAYYPRQPGELGNCAVRSGNDGYLYVAHQGNFHIKVFDRSGAVVRTIAPADIPAPDFQPLGIGVDDYGNLYLADWLGSPFLAVRSPSGEFSFISLEDGFMPNLVNVSRDGNRIYASYGPGPVRVYEGLYGGGPPPDVTPPQTTITLSGSLRNGWYSSDVAVTLSATDAESEVREIHYILDGGAETVVPGNLASLTVGAEGYHGITFHAVDNAGNNEADQSASFNIDKTPPVVTILGITNNGVYTLGAVPAASYQADDALSGVESSSASLSGGNANGSGSFIYAVTALDRAGNLSEISVTYSVVYAVSGFFPPFERQQATFGGGATIMVRLRLADASGQAVPDAVITLMLQRYVDGQPAGPPVPATSVTNIGNIFRFVPQTGVYFYKLRTRDLAEGTWRLIATADDGTVRVVSILHR